MTNQNELKKELLDYFDKNMFTPNIRKAEQLGETNVVKGLRLTWIRLQNRDAKGIVHYYWSAVSGTDKSIAFSKEMKRCGLVRFEDLLEDFRERFNAKLCM